MDSILFPVEGFAVVINASPPVAQTRPSPILVSSQSQVEVVRYHTRLEILASREASAALQLHKRIHDVTTSAWATEPWRLLRRGCEGTRNWSSDKLWLSHLTTDGEA